METQVQNTGHILIDPAVAWLFATILSLLLSIITYFIISYVISFKKFVVSINKKMDSVLAFIITQTDHNSENEKEHTVLFDKIDDHEKRIVAHGKEISALQSVHDAFWDSHKKGLEAAGA